MEELIEEEKRINERINEIYSYDELSDPKIYELSSRLGELWDNYDILTEGEKSEFYHKNKILTQIRFNVSKAQTEELIVLYRKLQIIADEKFKLAPPVATGDRLELKRMVDKLCTSYTILLKGTGTIVGDISYRGYHESKFLADIGFTINPEYRGNGYAHEALCLLSNILYDNNIKDFWITAFKDNYPSIKTIKKYGAEELTSDYENIAIFECPTRKYIYKNKEVIR